MAGAEDALRPAFLALGQRLACGDTCGALRAIERTEPALQQVGRAASHLAEGRTTRCLRLLREVNRDALAPYSNLRELTAVLEALAHLGNLRIAEAAAAIDRRRGIASWPEVLALHRMTLAELWRACRRTSEAEHEIERVQQMEPEWWVMLGRTLQRATLAPDDPGPEVDSELRFGLEVAGREGARPLEVLLRAKAVRITNARKEFVATHSVPDVVMGGARDADILPRERWAASSVYAESLARGWSFSRAREIVDHCENVAEQAENESWRVWCAVSDLKFLRRRLQFHPEVPLPTGAELESAFGRAVGAILNAEVSAPDVLLDICGDLDVLVRQAGDRRRAAFPTVQRALQDLDRRIAHGGDLRTVAEDAALCAERLRGELAAWVGGKPEMRLGPVQRLIVEALAGRDDDDLVSMEVLLRLVADARPGDGGSSIRQATGDLQDRNIIEQPKRGYYRLRRPLDPHETLRTADRQVRRR